ncbi:glucosamine-6-phosphate deaminase [Rathayibacter sp. VKM Ac-2760]|uniref:glucosamine-6-phosphate deaminase n=1 Tax=Rathayibacter sp. VKM Ac-2760 TaxID=2609253 RepID=UPI001319647F|nr:glucosamine-6-phosphate deaminase [Rathayibacter sp. VKM Ac-2760]QHC61033.1 glucosamine-6-phosphate deaminase [Rathayibacter sp. VKM Ac-2760]
MTVTVHIEADAPAVARRAAAVVLGDLAGRQEYTLGVATGSSPSGLYRELADAVSREPNLFYKVRAVALDEYVGLAPEDPRSYHATVRAEVVEPLRFDPALVRVPRGSARPEDYDGAIARDGGVDLQILGIGSNGHIAFNEPGSPHDSQTRVVALTEETRRDNARFFDRAEQVPTHAVTQGIGTVLRARRLLLIAQGAGKAAAVAAALEGPVTEDLPGSALQRHPDVTVVLDPEAAARLGAHRS